MRKALRPVLFLLAPLLAVIIAMAGSLPAQAEDLRTAHALDQLFEQLRRAPDAQTARSIDERIWTYWTTPADPKLAARMADILAARHLMEFSEALRLIDKVITDYPDYAEVWNQRATIHFLQDDYAAALIDIDRVLTLEPRHFGALVGRAMIYRAQGKRALAIKDMARALSLHPFLSEKILFPELMHEVTQI